MASLRTGVPAWGVMRDAAGGGVMWACGRTHAIKSVVVRWTVAVLGPKG